MIIAGLGFKSSSAPFHMWTPDVYEGAPTTVTAFMSAATKVAAFALAFRVLRRAFPQEEHLWCWAFAGIAVASLAIGNFAALVQREREADARVLVDLARGLPADRRRRGSALGGRALMYYLILYCGDGVRLVRRGRRARARARRAGDARQPRRLRLGAAVPRRSRCGSSCSASRGFPLGGGFVAKFYVFSAAYEHGWAWLVIVGVLATLVSLYYYLAVVRAMYMRPSGGAAGRAGAAARLRASAMLHAAVGLRSSSRSARSSRSSR